jgi:hypothetical protein
MDMTIDMSMTEMVCHSISRNSPNNGLPFHIWHATYDGIDKQDWTFIIKLGPLVFMHSQS